MVCMVCMVWYVWYGMYGIYGMYRGDYRGDAPICDVPGRWPDLVIRWLKDVLQSIISG